MTRTHAPEEVARYENATWSRCAPGYMDGFGALADDAAGPLLDALALERGDRMLDLGTGPGLVAARAAERGATAVGVDFSEPMLAEARRRHPGIEFVNAPAEALPFEDGAFDAVAANLVLHHTGAPDRVLAEARRVLRPGGRIAFTVWAAPETLEAFGLFFAAVERHADAAELPHGPLFGVSDPAVFRALAAGAGLADAEVRTLPLVWRTATIDGYLAAFRDWADLGAFPDDVAAAIEQSVRAEAERYRTGAGFALPNPALLVESSRP